MKRLSLLCSVLASVNPFCLHAMEDDFLAGVSIDPPSINGRIEGSLKVNTAGAFALNGKALIENDLLLPGSPRFTYNGKVVRPPIVEADGGLEPQGYRVTLNGNARLGRIVVRSDAIEIPVTVAPHSPAGHATLVINRPGDIPADLSGFRSIVINRNVGEVFIPPGRYDQLICNGGARVRLGVSDQDDRSLYEFRAIILNNGSVDVESGVLVRLGSQMTLNGNSRFGSTAHPEWSHLEIHQGGLTLNGNARFYGRAVAPSGQLTLNGGALMVGHGLARRIIVNGNGTLRYGDTISDPVQPPDPPVAHSASYSLWAGDSMTLTLEADAGPDDVLSFSVIEMPQQGELTTQDGSPIVTGAKIPAEAMPLQFVASEAGEDQLTFTAENAGGTSEPAVIRFSVWAIIPPSIAFIEKPQPFTNNRRPDVVAQVTPGSAELDPELTSFFLNGAPVATVRVDSTYRPSWSQDLSDGPYALEFRAVDLRGNVASESVSFTVDATPPLIMTDLLMVEIVVAEAQPTFSFTGSDDLAGIDPTTVGVTIGGQPATVAHLGEGTFTWTPTSPLVSGRYAAALTAVDFAGNATTCSVSFGIDDPAAAPEVEGLPAYAGGEVRGTDGKRIAGAQVRVRGQEGGFRTGEDGSCMVAASHFDDLEVRMEILEFSAPGYITSYRRVKFYPGTVNTFPPVYLKERDSKITMVGPQGGTISNSDGSIVVEFPAGVLASFQPVQATNYEAGHELAFPLPNTVGFTFALELIPEGLTFPEPVSVRMRNDLGFAPGTAIPVGYFNPEAVRWQHESMAFVSDDGQWVEFEVTHFSVWDINLPVPDVPVPVDNSGDVPVVDPQAEEIDPYVTIGRGVGTVSFSLPAVQSMGVGDAVSFVYRSDHASSSKLFDLTYQTRSTGSYVTRFSIGIGGAVDEVVAAGGSFPGGRISSVLVEREALETGLYPYFRSIANEVDVPFGTFSRLGRRWGSRAEFLSNVRARELVARSSRMESWTFWRNEAESPFGAGWTLPGLDKIVAPVQAENVVLVRGDGGHAVFEPRAFESQPVSVWSSPANRYRSIDVIQASPEGGFIISSDGELFRWLPGSEPVLISEGIERLVSDGYGGSYRAMLDIKGIAVNQTGEVYISGYWPSGEGIDLEGRMTRGMFRQSLYDGETAEILGWEDWSWRGIPLDYDHNGSRIFFLKDGQLGYTSEDGRHVVVCPEFENVIAFAIDHNRSRLIFASEESVYGVPVGVDEQFSDPELLFSMAGSDQPDNQILPASLALAPDGTISLLTRSKSSYYASTWLTRLRPSGALAAHFEIGFLSASSKLVSDISGNLYVQRDTNELLRLFLPTSGQYVFEGEKPEFLDHTADGWKWNDTHGNEKLFNAEGHLTADRDSKGNTTTFAYDQAGHLLSKVNPLGRETRFTYDGSGLINTVTDAAGRTTHFFHNAWGQLARVRFPDGAERVFDYDERNRMTHFTDEEGFYTSFQITEEGFYREIHFPDGGVIELAGARTRASGLRPELPSIPLASAAGLPAAVSANARDTIVNQLEQGFSYQTDAAGRFTRLLDAEGHEIEFKRDFFGRPVRITDPHGYQRFFVYDLNGNMTGRTREDGRSLVVEYSDPHNLPTEITGYGGERTSITYDSKGNPVRIVDPLGRATVLSYNTRGQLLSVTNPAGETWTHRYDAVGNLTATTDPAGGVTAFAYDLSGNVTTVTDPTGRATNHTYDLMGRLLSTTQPGGGVWTRTYTPRGLLASVTDPLGRVEAFTYDAKGRLAKATDSSGGDTVYTYDAADNLLSVTNPAGEVTRYVYDGNNKLISVLDGDSPPAEISYDGLGRPLSVTDANGRTTERIYDALGQLVTLIRPDGEAVEMEYDVRGNLVRLLDPRGGGMTWSHDMLGRRLTETNAIGETLHYAYDAAGRMVQQTNRRGQKVDYDYDPAGRLVRLALEGGDVNTYTYDAAGRLIGAQNAHAAIVRSYDSAGRLTASQQPAGQLNATFNMAGDLIARSHSGGSESYGYDAAGRLNHLATTAFGTFSFGYDGASRMNRVVYPNAVELAMQRNGKGRVNAMAYQRHGIPLEHHTRILDAVGNTVEDARLDLSGRSFAYDDLDQLLSVASGGWIDEALNYDSLGNWLVDGRDHDLANRLLTDSMADFSYDPDGNLTGVSGADENATFTYDALGRLERVGTPGQEVGYRYDPLGRRYAVTVNGLETLTLFDGWEEVGERQGSVFQSWLTVGSLRLAAETGEGAVYLHAGLEGSILAATGSDGSVRERYHYSAFGVLSVLDATGEMIDDRPPLSPWLYHGRVHERATGFYWLRARHYSPGLGRFLQPDPLGVAGGINLYTYANNNPLRWFDPWGLTPQTAAQAQGGQTKTVMKSTEQVRVVVHRTPSSSLLDALTMDLYSVGHDLYTGRWKPFAIYEGNTVEYGEVPREYVLGDMDYISSRVVESYHLNTSKISLKNGEGQNLWSLNVGIGFHHYVDRVPQGLTFEIRPQLRSYLTDVGLGVSDVNILSVYKEEVRYHWVPVE